MPTSSRVLILAGVVAVLLGLLAHSPDTLRTLFGWFGRLPGDIRYSQNGDTFIALPWVSLLVVSGVLSLLSRFHR